MAFIKVVNNDSFVLIDDEFQNYGLVEAFHHRLLETFTMPESSQVFWENIPHVYKGHTNSQPMVAILSDRNFTIPCALTIVRSGNDFTIHFHGNIQQEAYQYVNILIYDLPSPEYMPTGLVVLRNAEGKVTFDSGRRLMKVIGTIKSGETKQIPLNTAVAYTSMRLGYRMVYDPYTRYHILDYRSDFIDATNNGTTLRLSNKSFKSFTSSTQPATPSNWPSGSNLGVTSALLIDASGIF